MRLQKVFVTVISVMLFSACENVRDPQPADCSSSNLSLNLSSSTAASDCSTADGSFSVLASGGEGDYQYKIGQSGTLQDSPDFSSVSPGLYTVIVTDAKGCTAELSVSVASEAGLAITGVNITPSGCESSDGVIEVQVTGSTGTVEYSLDGGTFVTSNTFTGLSAGTYTVAVRDEAGCELTADADIKTGISFDIIKDIINTNCAVSGCHVSGTAQPDFTVDQNIKDRASAIKTRTSSGSMPPAGRDDLTQEQIDQIACWVDDGANLN